MCFQQFDAENILFLCVMLRTSLVVTCLSIISKMNGREERKDIGVKVGKGKTIKAKG